jgi:acyl-CoA reductase-like NAD-dependent aldehyde dehydrogenase/nicotinamidase-related amidase
MKAALLIVDLQRDFLERAGLEPAPAFLVAEARHLLEACRARSVPIAHVHTLVHRNGSNRMPHWKRAQLWSCVEGTSGAEPPQELSPGCGERVFVKQHFSAFQAPGLHEHLTELGADTLILAGNYLHACVRASVLDAYERGYEAWVAEDAVGSTEPVHAEITRQYLETRAARFLSTGEILAALSPPARIAAAKPSGRAVAAACIDGFWESGRGGREHLHWNPSRTSELLTRMPICGADLVHRAAQCARSSQRAWSATPGTERRQLLEAWVGALERRSGELVETLCLEIGKPRTDSEAELDRGLALIRTAAELPPPARDETPTGKRSAAGRARLRPLGVVGIVTPWNNPLAIPAGKIAPALALGNAVVWKPAPQAALVSTLVMETILAAGFPGGLVNLVFGDASTGRQIACEPEVDALSITGSTRTGASAAALCAAHHKRLQAELGGNNAQIVLEDCDLEAEIQALAHSAYSFAGQRCTAIRRFIVQRSIARDFEQRFASAARSLAIGDPSDERTDIGPLISEVQRARTLASIGFALAMGARKLCGGGVPPGFEGGNWVEPTLLECVDERLSIAREETFGPLALLIPAGDLEDAIRITNAVPQGLVAGISTSNERARSVFLERAEAGVLKLDAGPLAVHPELPFGGWKSSGIGPPEHGIWDRDFYSRPQAIYGSSAP